LEDDFFFNPKIKEVKHRENISLFLKQNENKPFIYLLGCVPTLIVPFDRNNYRGTLTGAMHCVIYNKFIRTKIEFINQSTIKDWDGLAMTSLFNYKYIYYTPLCYQLFPETENSKNWGDEYGILKIFPIMYFRLNSLLGMDKMPEPGYSVHYFFSKLFFFIILVIIILIGIKIPYYYKRNGKVNRIKH
jgi:hypothetical protein